MIGVDNMKGKGFVINGHTCVIDKDLDRVDCEASHELFHVIFVFVVKKCHSDHVVLMSVKHV